MSDNDTQQGVIKTENCATSTALAVIPETDHAAVLRAERSAALAVLVADWSAEVDAAVNGWMQAHAERDAAINLENDADVMERRQRFATHFDGWQRQINDYCDEASLTNSHLVRAWHAQRQEAAEQGATAVLDPPDVFWGTGPMAVTA